MSYLRCFAFLCFAAALASATGEEAAVSLPLGETYLGDIAASCIGYQMNGKEPVLMPQGWGGGVADPQSGIVFRTNGQQRNRKTTEVHPPWRGGTGKEWFDYSLTLPTEGPIHLSFGIAMRYNLWATDNNSDGATFCCRLTADGQEKELMQAHSNSFDWECFDLDLSPYAGKTIGLRFQVDPGPKNNATCDASVWGDIKITAGDVQKARAEKLQHLRHKRAYQAVEKADLKLLVNRSGQGITPSNLLPYSNSCDSQNGAYRFTYQAEDCQMVYTYQPTSGTLDDWTVQIDDAPAFQPAQGGGLSLAKKDGDKTIEQPLRGGRLIKANCESDVLHVAWQYDADGQPLDVNWTFKLLGKSLIVSAQCDTPVIRRMSLGSAAQPLRRTIKAPYTGYHADSDLVYLPIPNVYSYRCMDWTQSHASSTENDAIYDTLTDGARNPLSETAYIAVSPHLNEVLPNIPWPASPYLQMLAPKIMLDIWGHQDGSFAGDGEILRDLKDNGIDHLAIIQHKWQHYGYDVKLPEHMPANPKHGGDEGMIAFGHAANDCGYVWSLHENYIDMYPDAPSYDETKLVRGSDGTLAKGWLNKITQTQSYRLKSNRAMEFALKNSPEEHRRYGTTASYLDVHTCVFPSHLTDCEPGQPMAGMQQASIQYNRELFQFMRDIHGGPLFGEGARHFYWAGLCDGVEAQVDGAEDHEPLLDFDLLKIHPQMVNHGMGYFERWFRAGYQHRWGCNTGSMEQIDKYRAQEIAYGHAGFIGGSQVANILWIAREHHVMHPVQALYGAAKATEIKYEVDGQWVDASIAAAMGETTRQRVCYDSGLTVWINWRDEPWTLEGQILPQWGFLAKGPETEASMTMRNGHWSNYAECPEYVFADARTTMTKPYGVPFKAIEPRLRSCKYLGDNRIEVTYEWLVNDTIEGDYRAFIHAQRFGQEDKTTYAFQQDHNLQRPTSTWKPGETILDGPYVIALPSDADGYELSTGLFKTDRSVSMWCNRGFGNDFRIAKLKVERKGDTIVNVVAENILQTPHKTEIDFTTRLNPEGTLIDFGSLVTDGTVKVERKADRLIVFPYPRDKAFRVILHWAELAKNVDLSTVRLRAFSAGKCEDLGPTEFKAVEGRLEFTVGKAGAGRYEILWK